ncbi:MAG: TonB-dependent receptor [Opitutaceae bacterium]|nr:TonB-dependent receptor [Opitutaceae bacterium]
MKSPLRLHAFAATLMLALSAHAADTTGAIAGRVQNVATGQYLNNARITVRGTDRVVFSDESGTYRVPGLAAGAVTLQFFYTGLDPQEITVTVAAGEIIERNVDLTSAARYGPKDGTVKLDAFTVASSRDTNADSIATNEQRFAPNLKNVISADAFGDVTDGNVGEFLKFLPGITAEYDAESGSAVSSVAVRGFPTSMAVVSGDGMQMANTGNPQGSSRVFQFTQVSMNNLARLEVTKVPTPSTPADSMSGSINMVSKSSFERKTAQLRWSASLSGNQHHLSLRSQPHTPDRRVQMVRPSANFDYTLPVTRNFGLVVTGQVQNRYMWQQLALKAHNATAANTGATFARPFLQQFQLPASPRLNRRSSAGLRADWRVSANGVLSFNGEASRFVSDRSSTSAAFDTGANPAPTVVGGVPLTFGDNFTSGATGRAGVSLMGLHASVRHQLDTKAGSTRYRYDNGDWRLESGLGYSRSQGGYQDTIHGRFRTLATALRNPARLLLADVDQDRPRTIKLFDNAGQDVDFFNLNNFRLNTANSTPRYIRDDMLTAKLDVRKSLPWLAFPAALQMGGSQRIQERDVRRQSINWTYAGPDHNTATIDSPAPYGMTTYVGQTESYGFRNMPWISVYKAWEAFKADPLLWQKTPAQLVAEESFRITNSENLYEGVTALYAQAEAGLFKNRLRVLGGVRFEKTSAKGQGVLNDPNAVWLRDADGSYAHAANGARIRRTEAGAAGSMEELRLIRRERAIRAARTYEGYYPSLHLTYNVSENLQARLSYAQTYGRPDFTNIVPNSTIDEADLENIPPPTTPGAPPPLPGTINIRNTGLKPWSADNVDFSAEYYTASGGLFSAGAFAKEIRDFFGSSTRLATAAELAEVGLGPEYAGWQLTTQFNLAGVARIRGVEFNARHSLRPLGEWGKPFQIFANATKLNLAGSQQANFNAFIRQSASWGVSWNRAPFSVLAKWNYRGQQRGGQVAAVNGYQYGQARTTVDLNAEWQFRKNIGLYLNAQNVFNEPEVLLRFGPDTPGYARRYQATTYGVQFSAGLRGTF